MADVDTGTGVVEEQNNLLVRHTCQSTLPVSLQREANDSLVE